MRDGNQFLRLGQKNHNFIEISTDFRVMHAYLHCEIREKYLLWLQNDWLR